MTAYLVCYKGTTFTMYAHTMHEAFTIARDIVDGDPLTSALATMQSECNEYHAKRAVR